MSDTAPGEKQNLFSDFPVPSYDEWRTVTEQSLKGASFEKKLLTKTYEGITLQPMYRQDEASQLEHPATLPGFPPYVRGTHAAGYLAKPWDIAQEIPYSTPTEFNQALRFDMERGQTVVNIVLDQASRAGKDPDQAQTDEVGRDGVSIASLDDLSRALEGIDLETTPVFIQAEKTAIPFAALLIALAQKQGKATANLRGLIAADPLGALAQQGSLPVSLNHAYDSLANLTSWAAENAPGLHTLAVHSHPYYNSGGSIVQELAFVLATGVEYIRAFQERGLAIDTIATHMDFAFSIGSNVFMEIAKLRAARLLWSQVVAAFGGSAEAQKMTIHGRTTTYNKTVYDPYVNMLRTTVEAFAGAIGGLDSMHVAPFDQVFRQPDEFSRRIARNTHLVLQQECNFTRLIDPVGGSWYVETLTDTLAKEAWKMFQEVEKKGGMLKALQEGFPQAQVDSIAQQRVKALSTRKDVLLGTNMYPNLYEKRLEGREANYAALQQERSGQVTRGKASLDALTSASNKMTAAVEAAAAGATLGELTGAMRAGAGDSPSVMPLRIHRAAEMFESLRNASDKYKERTGSLPQVFLATMGPLVQHKARADFTTGFLEVSGLEMIRPSGFDTPEEAAKAAIDSGARVVVICSTDDTYPDIVPPLTKQLKEAASDMMVILAGYPADHVEAFKAAGVDDFIHLRANCYDMNVKLHQKIGVSA